MNLENLDLEALIRGVLAGICVGAIVGSIGFFVTSGKRRWPVLLMGTFGVILLAGLITYYAWPSLVNVPSLDGLSQAQAEDLLAKNRLRADARPQYVAGVDAGRVISGSQSHSAGLPVRYGTVLSFAIAEPGGTSSAKSLSPINLDVSL